MSLSRCFGSHAANGTVLRSLKAAAYPGVMFFRTYSISKPVRNRPSEPLSVQSLTDRISGTWFVPDPENADYNVVLARLPQLRPPRRGHLTSALFLVTPKLAQWFDLKHPFHQEAINHIYQPMLPDHLPESFVAVVDALPVPSDPWQADYRPLPGCEGIAVCLFPDKVLQYSSSQAQRDQALIRFNSMPGVLGAEKSSMLSVTLPTANTLFVNGLASTMFKQAWAQGEEEEQRTWIPKDGPVYLSSLSVPINSTPRTFARYEVPLQPITPAREIISSMGNVLRELHGDDGSSLRASTELERNVPQYIRERESQGLIGSAKVFALVMPPWGTSTLDDKSGEADVNDNHTSPLENRADHRSTAKDDTMSGKAVFTALSKGGRILRVTGGGGGWGKKQGLLSLDNKINFSNEQALETSMFPSFEDETPEDSKSAPEELLPVGHMVQFFATWQGPQDADYLTKSGIRKSPASKFSARDWSQVFKRHWVFGTTTASEEAPLNEGASAETHTDVYCFDKHFGMLSQNGLCLALEVAHHDGGLLSKVSLDYDTAHQFRIDVPLAVVRCISRDPTPFTEGDPPGRQKQDELLSAENVIRKQRVQRRNSNGRPLKMQKHPPPGTHEARLPQELQPDKRFTGEVVPGYRNLDDHFSLITQPDIERPDLDPMIRLHYTQDHGKRKVSPQPAASKSQGGPQQDNTGPRIRRINAPNNVSWDRPRANVKPGQSPSSQSRS